MVAIIAASLAVLVLGFSVMLVNNKEKTPQPGHQAAGVFCSVDPVAAQTRFHVGLNEIIAYSPVRCMRCR